MQTLYEDMVIEWCLHETEERYSSGAEINSYTFWGEVIGYNKFSK